MNKLIDRKLLVYVLAAFLAIQPLRWAWSWFDIQIAKERVAIALLSSQVDNIKSAKAEYVEDAVEKKKERWW